MALLRAALFSEPTRASMPDPGNIFMHEELWKASKIEVAGREVVVVTSHLESTKQLPFPAVRCKQLKEICDSFLLGVSSPALFCGDTNLSFNQQYKKQDDVVALGESKNALDDAYLASGAEKECFST